MSRLIKHAAVLTLLPVFVLIISSNFALPAQASNWHSGYKFHDRSLGFDIYWKWGDLMDIKHDMVSIRAVSSIAVTELCAISLTDIKEMAYPTQVQMNLNFKSFNGLPRYQDMSELVFSEDQSESGGIESALFNNGKLIRTTIHFVRCDSPYPNLNVPSRSQYSYPTWNGLQLIH